MVRAICRACRWTTPVDERLPDACPRCESPFFWYRRTDLPRYTLTETDRLFLRSAGIAADEEPTAGAA